MERNERGEGGGGGKKEGGKEGGRRRRQGREGEMDERERQKQLQQYEGRRGGRRTNDGRCSDVIDGALC